MTTITTMTMDTTTSTELELGASWETAERPHILVVGLGNLLLQDDGVGVHAVYALQQETPPGVCVADVGCAVLDALHLFEWADRIIAIDAMQAGGAPGTVYTYREDDVADNPMPVSLHEVSIKAAFRFTDKPIAAEILFIGVEPDVIDYGLELTPDVEAAMPTVLKAVRDMIGTWREQACPVLAGAAS